MEPWNLDYICVLIWGVFDWKDINRGKGNEREENFSFPFFTYTLLFLFSFLSLRFLPTKHKSFFSFHFLSAFLPFKNTTFQLSFSSSFFFQPNRRLVYLVVILFFSVPFCSLQEFQSFRFLFFCFGGSDIMAGPWSKFVKMSPVHYIYILMNLKEYAWRNEAWVIILIELVSICYCDTWFGCAWWANSELCSYCTFSEASVQEPFTALICFTKLYFSKYIVIAIANCTNKAAYLPLLSSLHRNLAGNNLTSTMPNFLANLTQFEKFVTFYSYFLSCIYPCFMSNHVPWISRVRVIRNPFLPRGAFEILVLRCSSGINVIVDFFIIESIDLFQS